MSHAMRKRMGKTMRLFCASCHVSPNQDPIIVDRTRLGGGHGVDRNVGRKVDQVNEGASRLDEGTYSMPISWWLASGSRPVLDWPRLPASPSMVDEISPPACRTSSPPGHRSLA